MCSRSRSWHTLLSGLTCCRGASRPRHTRFCLSIEASAHTLHTLDFVSLFFSTRPPALQKCGHRAHTLGNGGPGPTRESGLACCTCAVTPLRLFARSSSAAVYAISICWCTRAAGTVTAHLGILKKRPFLDGMGGSLAWCADWSEIKIQD
jgi:hypothetical protein